MLYEVQEGDTLTAIAQQFGTSVEELCQLNGIEAQNVILTGDRIRFSGHSHSITLKKFFIAQKIPQNRRASIPVLADDRGQGW